MWLCDAVFGRMLRCLGDAVCKDLILVLVLFYDGVGVELWYSLVD